MVRSYGVRARPSYIVLRFVSSPWGLIRGRSVVLMLIVGLLIVDDLWICRWRAGLMLRSAICAIGLRVGG